MADRVRHSPASSTVLQIRDLHVYYGQSHALQGVDLTLKHGVHAVVGRNGMGKTTLCNAIMGLLPVRRGSIRYRGEELTSLPSFRIAAKGVGYTPQGRRLWPSLSVEEHLRLADAGGGAWTIERIYDTFPRLSERRRNGAGQLSGGEQQMLAISRALLQDPQLLVLDEPTEGLAPIVVDQVENLLATLAAERDVAILLIEQNIAVATAISQDVAVMVNGRIWRVLAAQQLASDRALQERLLGVGRHSHEDIELPAVAAPRTATERTVPDEPTIGSQEAAGQEQEEQRTELSEPASNLIYMPPTRWASGAWKKAEGPQERLPQPASGVTAARPFDSKPEPIFKDPLTPPESLLRSDVFVAGTFDTKSTELNFIRNRIANRGLRVRTIDLSTSGKPSSADVPPNVIAAYHRHGANAVFTNDRGASVRAMSVAFENWIQRQRGIGGIISAGGSGGTALVTPAMRSLPVGVPKIMISTVASGDVSRYVGPSDIMMMYSVTDVQGLNRISRRILSNGADALVGMVKDSDKDASTRSKAEDKPGLGLTMFGVTTQAIRQIVVLLEDRYDCLVFHATGTGGRSMEKLAESGMLVAAIDLTTTEICDMMMDGVFAANEDRFGAFIRTRIPYVGSVGALDMVNFGAPVTVPDKYKDRLFVEHNPEVTLMRTSPEENTRMGDWIAGRLNEMTGPVRFLVPEGGVSALDAPGQPFHDPAANQALFDAISRRFQQTDTRRLIRSSHHINDPAFAKAAVEALEEVNPTKRTPRHAAF